ncbi:MAG: aspartate kinase [Saprospiraceae bacterium]|nr:aspartate kinase [Saprospiraceae bacterium]
MQVFKFGGASIRDAMAIRQMAHLLASYRSESLVLVISAMGKTTNALEHVVKSYWDHDESAREQLEGIRQQHIGLVDELFAEASELKILINDLFVEAEWVIDDELHDSYNYIYDQIVAVGELVATRIIETYLAAEGFATEWMDVRALIRTNDNYREAEVLWPGTRHNIIEKIHPVLQQNRWAVTQGFVGGTSENNTTTLGREGSDFSAAIIAACLGAESVIAWKNVPGIMTADPVLYPDAEKLDQLSYREAIEMTYYGAKVIHPRTIQPLMEGDIPLVVRSFDRLDDPGTLISGVDAPSYPPIHVSLRNRVLLYVSTGDFSFIAEDHLSDLFTLFAKHNIKVELMRNSAVSFTVCVRNDPHHLKLVLAELSDNFHVLKDSPVELLTVRHYQKQTLSEMTIGRTILLQELNPSTAQLVLSME